MKVKVAFSDLFFNSLTQLQPNVQAKVNQMVLKFQSNPKSPGLNYEKLNAAKDKNMRSLRVDQAYRVILLAPEEDNVYLFLWADHHDAAYSWAQNHRCDVNRSTGAIQLYSVDENVEAQSVDESVTRAFSALKDRELQKLGVPEEQLVLVRSIENETGLDAQQAKLPADAYEGLFLYMAGETYEDILRDREVDLIEDVVDISFLTALERVQSKASFMVPEDESELLQMLNAPLDKWRVFLHPSQRRLVEGKKNGPARVLGGAGTGKTVVAIHRARWLAHQIDDDRKILFTTFTKNLAVDIQQNLQSICSNEELARIEVVNLDRWVQAFLRSHSYDYRVEFDSASLDEYWHIAISEKPSDLDFLDSFFKEEWQRVIQPQGIQTLDEYKRASRIGRGTRLNREQRVRIWPVFEEYRSQLNRMRLKETDDAYRDAADLITTKELETNYSSVVVDEAQDMGTQAFRLLRAIVEEKPNDLFIVGDAHQRIYGKNRVVLGRCGINIRGRSRKLKINYRTTDEIRKWAVHLLEGRVIDDLDGGADSNSIYKSLTHGESPQIENLENASAQAKFIGEILTRGSIPAGRTCVVARIKREVAEIKRLLEDAGIKCAVIKPSEPEVDSADTLKLATIHRVKGLEFDQIVLASANAGLIPLDLALMDKGDEVSSEEAETEERSLVYVAITRARKNSYILSYGEPSPFLLS